MKLIKFRRDGSLAVGKSKLRLELVHFVGTTEAYIALPGTRAIEVHHPLRGFTLWGLLPSKREQHIVAVEEGDGFPLMPQHGFATAYRAPAYPTVDYEELVENAAHWEAQNTQAIKQRSADNKQFAALVALVFLLAVPIVVLALFGALPEALEGFQNATAGVTGEE